jgi:predicted DNA-binding ribbon-helix-helix protein
MPKSRLVNRNVRTTRLRTSIRLEPEFWEALDEICYIENVDRNELVCRIESAEPTTGRTSAVRVLILQHLRSRERSAAHRAALNAIGTRDDRIADAMHS